MNNERKVRCEHNTQNWSYKNKTGELVSFEAILTGQINLETNETSISDHLEVTKNSQEDEVSEFALQNIREIMEKDLEEQLRD